MSSIFSNSQNILITGGQLISNNTRIEGSQNGLDVLRHRTALAALLDSTERFDPPKCAPDTRVAIINDILDWVSNDDEFASIMWLYGPAGTGKSALAQTVAEICREHKRLVATFFFSRTATNRSDGRILISTLAYQLMLAFPSTRRFIRGSVEGDPTIFERANETQMEGLFVEPVNQFSQSWLRVIYTLVNQSLGCITVHEPRLIVIDGLDECHDPRMQSDLLKTIGEATERLKLPLKFLISSRPESHILHVFNHDLIFRRLNVKTFNLSSDNIAHHDIKVFLSRQFDEIKRTHPLRSYLHVSWPPPEAIRELVRKSSGQFIYASTVIKYVQSPKHRPDDRLSVVLGLSPAPSHETPFAQLDALYSHIFASVHDI
ncbi:hypothetical protein GALMADRAFT_449836 [Galerina marginata CBS 339.88]|uniref:Nephrocystin 3-like N-terminal domain-containing protein n=1 Tax=Galerina marginata (strain CBS 339.88) TaxID=685588 RepID=A0A067T027_GALM3|nr:hypothetical protein GALMADRAFT_449836 [Galerina marginata CBS 339.88]